VHQLVHLTSAIPRKQRPDLYGQLRGASIDNLSHVEQLQLHQRVNLAIFGYIMLERHPHIPAALLDYINAEEHALRGLSRRLGIESLFWMQRAFITRIVSAHGADLYWG
jgi:hypothetical protein